MLLQDIRPQQPDRQRHGEGCQDDREDNKPGLEQAAQSARHHDPATATKRDVSRHVDQQRQRDIAVITKNTSEPCRQPVVHCIQTVFGRCSFDPFQQGCGP